MESVIKRLSTAFKTEDFLVDLSELVTERSQRFRIRDSIFEDIPEFSRRDSNSDTIEDNGVLKIPHTTQSITFNRVGVEVFSDSNAGKEFNEEKLYLNLVQSKSPKTTNHPVYHISRTDLYEVILRGLIKQRLHKQAISNHILEFTFLIMSCHSSELLVEACYDTLKYHLQTNAMEEGRRFKTWTPSLECIMSVFANYGASKDLLASYHVPLPWVVSPNEPSEEIPPAFPIKNIVWVLKYISSVLSCNKSEYTVKELDQLLCIILTVSLDKHIVHMDSVNVNLEFSKCIKRILKSYPSSVRNEKGKISDVCEILYSKLRSVCVSDLYFVLSYYLASPGFGQRLVQSLTYCFIKSGIKPSNSMSYLDEVDVKDISKIFRPDSLLEVDYFSQYYIILNVEKIITHLIFTSSQQRNLNKLRQLLSNLRIKLPHSEDMVDYLLVKQLITRASTTWKLSVTEID